MNPSRWSVQFRTRSGNLVSIVAICPHCETRFTLQDELLGKSMRCPNLECRQVFTVRDSSPPGPPPSPKVGEAVQILEAELVSGPPTAKPRKKEKAKPAPRREVVDAAVVSPPEVKEVVWSAEAAPPPPGRKAPVRAESLDDDEPIIRRRQKKSNIRQWVLIGMGVGIFVALGVGVSYVVKYQNLTETNLAKQADDEYRGGNYAAAAKTFDQLAAEFPKSDDAAKYKFFADLSSTRAAVSSVTNREDPDAAVKKLRGFIDAQKDNPFAAPKEYGHDILDAGKKVVEDVRDFIKDRVTAFRSDRAKTSELDRATTMIATGRDLLPVIEPFRTPEDPPLDAFRKEFDKYEGEIKFERNRLGVIARIRPILETASDRAIEEVVAIVTGEGLEADGEIAKLIADTKGQLGRQVRYIPDPAAPRAPELPTAASLLFVAPIGPVVPVSRSADAPPPAVFLGVARGVLYALDEDAGKFLWAVRVGPDVFDPPAVAKVELDDGSTELAVVVSNVAGQPAVSGYGLRSGKPRWYQPLPAPAAGPAVVAGARAYVPVRDTAGTVVEFDLTTGTRIGRIVLGQPVGPGGVMRPGTGLLYLPAEARRVYVLDVGAKDDDGNRLPPRCVQVIATGHPGGTLRSPPVLIGPEGDTPGDRWLVLAQADSPTATKLRAFPVPPIEPSAPGAPPPPETPASPAAEWPMPGWAWFPPVSDGERMALVTDAGQLRIFGVNQPGNLDRAVFPLPVPTFPTPADGTPVPGLVVPAEEGAYCVLAGGLLRKVRLTLNPTRGQEVATIGNPIPVGVPTQPPQLTPRRDLAFLVVRSTNSSGCRALLVDLAAGQIRWQRQLGLVPAAEPRPSGDTLLLADEDGGVTAIPPAGLSIAAGETRVAEPDWLLAPTLENITGPTVVATAADGKTIYTITPVGPAGAAKFLTRRFVEGKLVHTGTVSAPAALAGSPAVLGESLLLPTADGFVYRVIPGDGKLRPDTLAPGPRWWEDRRNPNAVCFVTPVSDEAFLTSDGGKILTRWTWPAGRNWGPGGMTWELRDRVATPPLVLPPPASGGVARLMVADASGGVWLYPLDRNAPLRRWRPGGPVPVGKPTTRFAVQPDPNGRQLVAYVVEGRHLVCLDPDKDTVLWVKATANDPSGTLLGAPLSAGTGRWLVTDLSGRVVVFEGDTGKIVASGEVGLPGAVPAVAGTLVDGARVFVPLSDGSAVVVSLPDG